jgi:membrane protein
MADSEKEKEVAADRLLVLRRPANQASGDRAFHPGRGRRRLATALPKSAYVWIICAALAGWLISRIPPRKRTSPVHLPGNRSPDRAWKISGAHRGKKMPGMPNLLALAMELSVAVGMNVLRQKATSWRTDRSAKREHSKAEAGSMRRVSNESGRKDSSGSRSRTEKTKTEKAPVGTSRIAQALDLCKRTAAEWTQDKCPQLGAALAYYTVFSLAPLVLVLLAVFGLIFGGSEHAREKLTEQLRYLIDPSGVKVIQDIAANASEPKGGILATAIGIVVGLFGASGVFGQLQDALNTIWGVKPKPGRGIAGFVRTRFLSFSMVGGVCFLLLASLTVESLLRGFNSYLKNLLPGGDILALALFFAFDFGVILLLFAMIFRYLPDVKIAWRDVWIGAALTAVLFVIGKFVLALYLGSGAAGSAYGAASSLITLLLWIFYAAQILLFGAEFTQVYANTYGSQVEPQDHAVRVERTEVELPAAGRS